ncbi:signal recognition particle protein [Candidatus Woesearchaeota archaeon]|nr:signal recognition particle protein [Candidatus Woesearchaeota archaeon]
MVLSNLGEKLKESLRKLVKAGLIDPKIVDELIADIKKALIGSDVNIELANKICNTIRNRALKEKPPKGITAREHTINIVYEELTKFLGGQEGRIEITEKPTKIMLVGLFGSGKTTTAGKLAKMYKKKGLKVCLVQTDTWRPAAYDQLKQLAEKVHVPFYGEKEEKDPVKIIKKYEKDFHRFNVVIIDTAGRDALNKELIEEIKKVKTALNPHESLLVLSGDIGQGAQKQAQMFHNAVKVSGVIITKLDGTAKGGGALTACAATAAPVKFIGVGEHIEDLEAFKPKNFVGRLLGMGDLETLLKKAEEAMKKEDAEKMGKKMLKGDFTLQDLFDQMEAMKKMGPLSQVANMIPGMGMAKLPKGFMGTQEEKLKVWKHIMLSMTPEEKNNPDIIKPSRIERIAKGSGRSMQEVRELLKQYKQMKKVMKMMGSPAQMKKIKKMMGGKLPKNLPF